MNININNRKLALLLIDVIIINLALIIALLLRFDSTIPTQYLIAHSQLAPLITTVTIIFLYTSKLYNRIWEYASLDEMYAILKASTLSMVSVVAIIYLFGLATFPRSVYIIAWATINILIGFSRISWRTFREFLLVHRNSDKKILIIGAGGAGALLAREIHNNPQLGLKIIGFVDDDPLKRKQILLGHKVLGNRESIPKLVAKYGIDEIIIAMPSVNGITIRKLVEISNQTTAIIKILPNIIKSTEPFGVIKNIRQINMEDLLRREPVEINIDTISCYLANKTALVTGAGGSIGSELCRQLITYNPSQLILLDSCECNLFDIEMELLEAGISNISTQLIDIRYAKKLEKIFAQYKPQVIFHAAAYKHVPMLEKHPEEAITNNVIGTKNVAEMAHRFGAETFILISTDKAVNPTNVMGATKRIAELIIKDINRKSRTNYAAVRFGNVLGSRGSVVPIFVKQIEKGGPVTVTHPEMKRYFMTIPEAVQLVIQAGSLAQGGEIFVLDMGEPVKIDNLARDLVKLYGYEPDIDIPIEYVGVRPGEKLYEELFSNREGMAATKYDRIFISKKELDENYIGISRTINTMAKNALLDNTEILNLIHELIPEYKYTDSSLIGEQKSV